MPEDNKSFVFPSRILEQINECSSGGFILFTFDKDGHPEMHSFFDGPQQAMAMQYYVENWMKATETLNISSVAQDIKDSIDPAEEE